MRLVPAAAVATVIAVDSKVVSIKEFDSDLFSVYPTALLIMIGFLSSLGNLLYIYLINGKAFSALFE
jgi:hypothetical protein